MQTESHPDFVVFDHFIEILILSIFPHVSEFVYPSQYLDIREKCQICTIPIVLGEIDLIIWQLGVQLTRIFVLPYQQIGVSKVLVRRSTILGDRRMCNLCNLVDKDHHIFLQNFSACKEIVNEAEAIDGKCLLTRDHGIHVSTTRHVLGDDSRTSITETKDKQVTNLLNGVFKNCSFKI